MTTSKPCFSSTCGRSLYPFGPPHLVGCRVTLYMVSSSVTLAVSMSVVVSSATYQLPSAWAHLSQSTLFVLVTCIVLGVLVSLSVLKSGETSGSLSRLTSLPNITTAFSRVVVGRCSTRLSVWVVGDNSSSRAEAMSRVCSGENSISGVWLCSYIVLKLGH